MENEKVVQTHHRHRAVSLAAAFIVGWLGCLGVVQWKKAHEMPRPATAQAVEKSAKAGPLSVPEPKADGQAVAGKETGSAPISKPAVSEASSTPATIAAPVEPANPAADAVTSPTESLATTEHQRERELTARLFQKNRENLRVLTSR